MQGALSCEAYHFATVEIDLVKVVLVLIVSTSKIPLGRGSYIDQTLLLDELHIRKCFRS